jgi:hypothetical protein
LLEHGRGGLGAGLGTGGEALDRRLMPRHLRRHRLPDHLQRAGHLVQLLARNAQLAGIQRGEIDPARMLGLVGEAAQALVAASTVLRVSSSTQARAPDRRPGWPARRTIRRRA